MHICSIVGARPQFVKLAVICRGLADHTRWRHTIIHTGQHYDHGLSSVFFEELDIPEPDHHLGVGSASHAEQIGEMMKRLEPVLKREAPNCVLLFGDTNSTLAGAIVASRLDLPSAHVEAGLRSGRRSMPEEVNRIVADHLGDLLLCPTPVAVANLQREGLGDRAVLVGDVMYDAALMYRDRAETRARAGGEIAKRWLPGQFALATVHRQENTDQPERLRSIVDALDQIHDTVCPVVWPVHPRTRKVLSQLNIQPASASMIEPVSYLDMLLLESRARLILTDSGGVQKEAYFFKVPCVTLRDETEWRETLVNRCNVLAGADARAIVEASALSAVGPWTADYGDGTAGAATLKALSKCL